MLRLVLWFVEPFFIKKVRQSVEYKPFDGFFLILWGLQEPNPSTLSAAKLQTATALSTRVDRPLQGPTPDIDTGQCLPPQRPSPPPAEGDTSQCLPCGGGAAACKGLLPAEGDTLQC